MSVILYYILGAFTLHSSNVVLGTSQHSVNIFTWLLKNAVKLVFCVRLANPRTSL